MGMGEDEERRGYAPGASLEICGVVVAE